MSEVRQPQPPAPRIAAVVVTFNRRELVAACVGRLVAQTRRLDEILIVDNASTDGTRERLEERGLLAADNVSYVRMTHNSGGAGGFHEGMRRAYAAGHDWIWIMDDDGEPDVTAIAMLERHFADEDVAVLLPNIDNPDIGVAHRGYFLPRAQVRGREIARSLREDEWAGRPTVDIDYFSFVGPCFPRWLIDRIGLPRAEFFIHFDDAEYALRACAQGRAVVVTDAWIRHKEQQRVGAVEVRRTAGRQSNRVRYDSLWLRYFGYRNLVWLIARKRVDAPLLPLLVAHGRLLAGIVLHDDHKLRRLRFWNAALIDGLRGRFDNDKARRLLGR